MYKPKQTIDASHIRNKVISQKQLLDMPLIILSHQVAYTRVQAIKQSIHQGL